MKEAGFCWGRVFAFICRRIVMIHINRSMHFLNILYFACVEQRFFAWPVSHNRALINRPCFMRYFYFIMLTSVSKTYSAPDELFLSMLFLSNKNSILYTFSFLFYYSENIVFKYTFLPTLLRHINFTFSMLDSIFPLSFVIASIIPVHLPITISNIFSKLPFIYISCCPCKDTISLFFI